MGNGYAYGAGALAGGPAGSPAHCAVPVSRLTQRQEQPEAPVCALPWRRCQRRSGKAGRGADRREAGRGRTPEMRHPQGLRGLALPAPLRRFCSPCASPAAPGSGGSRDLRRWRLAGGRDGAAGNRCLPPHTHSQTAVSPVRAHPRPETPVPKCQANRSSPEALAGDPSSGQKKASAVGRRGWTCPPRGGGWGGGIGGSRSPCQAAHPPPRAPTSIHFCASEKAGSGGGSGCRG